MERYFHHSKMVEVLLVCLTSQNLPCILYSIYDYKSFFSLPNLSCDLLVEVIKKGLGWDPKIRFSENPNSEKWTPVGNSFSTIPQASPPRILDGVNYPRTLLGLIVPGNLYGTVHRGGHPYQSKGVRIFLG